MEQTWFIGIDWGYGAHRACLIDAAGRPRDTRTVDHTMAAITAYISWVLAETGAPPAAIGIAIEAPRGALVATWLERGFAVYARNPKQLDRFRDRFTVAGAKDDSRDAHVLADGLRTDARAFRRLQLEDPLVVQLRECARLDADGTRDLTRLTNQLRDQVYRIAPTLLALCPAADEPWFWTLLEAAPTPSEQQRLSRTAILALLKTHRIRRVTADEVRQALRADRFGLAAGVVEATRDALQALIPHLRFVLAQHKRCAQRQETLLAELRARPASEAESGEHRDVDILASLPGVGRKTTVTMLTDAAHLLATRDYAGLRTHAGVAPITKQSGKVRLVLRRLACNVRLREALYHWGRVSLQHDQRAAAYYQRLRARGQTHGRALRSVIDRWLRILVAMLRHRELYNPNRFPCAVPVST